MLHDVPVDALVDGAVQGADRAEDCQLPERLGITAGFSTQGRG
jgi:hypothetical protein